MSGKTIRGKVKITHFNGPMVDDFRVGANSFDIEVSAQIADPFIIGGMWPTAFPTRRLPFRMEHKSALP